MKNFNYKREKSFPSMHRFLTGLIIALTVSLTAFEWTTTKTTYSLPECDGCFDATSNDLEIMPEVEIIKEKLAMPEPPADHTNPDEIEITVNTPDKKADDNLTNDDSKPNESTNIDNTHLTNPNIGRDDENISDDIDKIHVAVEVFAHYDECANLSGEKLKECSLIDISNKIKKAFKISQMTRSIGGRQGVHLTFVINKEGEIVEIEALSSSSKSMTNDAINAIKKLPKMKPAMQQGRAVSLRVKIPIVVNID